MRRLQQFGLVLGFLTSTSLSAAAENHTARHGMVVTTHYLASEIGVDILRKGGNAIDAAVAIGYALAVVHPAAGNIGGGGFMTIRFADGHTRFIDFRERAPLAATATLFQDKDGAVIPSLSEIGYLAVGVPGTVLGLETARAEFGKLSRDTLLAPAITLADKGFILKQGDIDLIAEAAPDLAKDSEASAIFLQAGQPPKVGARLRQPALAGSLRAIAKGGTDAFYHGVIAERIVAASAAHGGILQKADFEGYKIHEGAPIACSYRGFDVTTAALPSSGGVTLCETLNILEGYDLSSMGFHSAQALHTLAEAMRYSFFDRNSALGDPAFVQNPVDHLIDKAYAADLRAKIQPDRATPSRDLGSVEPPREGPHTTDYVVIDRDGTAVSVVYTLNDWFGSKVVPAGTGIVLNNEMDDFSAKPGSPNADGLVTGESNAIQPGKAPLSSMTPTILSRDGKTVLVVGSFGSGTIITSIVQTIVNLVDYHMTIDQAIDAPRIHQQWYPDSIGYETGSFTPEVAHALSAMGYSLVEGTIAGATESILVGGARLQDHPAALYVGANDRRASVGAAVGW